jgi:hypothetical protein
MKVVFFYTLFAFALWYLYLLKMREKLAGLDEERERLLGARFGEETIS